MDTPLNIIPKAKIQRRDNKIGKVMRVIAIIIYLAGFIIGLILSRTVLLLFVAWICGFISGSFFLALAEIIFLLDSLFEAEKEKEQNKITCSTCGASLDSNAEICYRCGTLISTTSADDTVSEK